MGLDTNLFQYLLGLPFFIVFCCTHEVKTNEMIMGQITGFFFVAGALLCMFSL